MSHATGDRPPSYRTLLRNREFAGLTLAQVVSEWGDHFARVGLASLVLDRGGSFFLAALAFVSGYVPAVFGAALLSPLADRLPRRPLLLGCDLARCVLVGALALLAVPATPLWVLYVLLFLAAAVAAPFDAARAAVLPDVLPQRRDYLAGAGLSRVLYQVDQVVGLALAGIVVSLASPRGALAIDAVSFLLSFVVLLLTLRSRPAAAPILDERAGGPLRQLSTDVRAGLRDLLGDVRRRALVLFAWSASVFVIAPEGVALAYADSQGRSAAWGGTLMAAVPAGAAIGAVVVSRRPHVSQVRLLLPLAAAACLPLIVTFAGPRVEIAALLWALSGACQAFMVTVIATVNLLTAPAFRGRVNGLAAAGFAVSSALAYLLAGLVADVIGPARAVSIAGAVGLAVVAAAALVWPAQALRAAAGEPPQRLSR